MNLNNIALPILIQHHWNKGPIAFANDDASDNALVVTFNDHNLPTQDEVIEIFPTAGMKIIKTVQKDDVEYIKRIKIFEFSRVIPPPIKSKLKLTNVTKELDREVCRLSLLVEQIHQTAGFHCAADCLGLKLCARDLQKLVVELQELTSEN